MLFQHLTTAPTVYQCNNMLQLKRVSSSQTLSEEQYLRKPKDRKETETRTFKEFETSGTYSYTKP